MNLRQLQYFKTIAELEHYTRAAEKLNMAQIAGRLGVNKSTVSRTLCRARRRLHHILQYSL